METWRHAADCSTLYYRHFVDIPDRFCSTSHNIPSMRRKWNNQPSNQPNESTPAWRNNHYRNIPTVQWGCFIPKPSIEQKVSAYIVLIPVCTSESCESYDVMLGFGFGSAAELPLLHLDNPTKYILSIRPRPTIHWRRRINAPVTYFRYTCKTPYCIDLFIVFTTVKTSDLLYALVQYVLAAVAVAPSPFHSPACLKVP